ncbi:unnamed protein product [Parajaminaea phylloscopi]
MPQGFYYCLKSCVRAWNGGRRKCVKGKVWLCLARVVIWAAPTVVETSLLSLPVAVADAPYHMPIPACGLPRADRRVDCIDPPSLWQQREPTHSSERVLSSTHSRGRPVATDSAGCGIGESLREERMTRELLDRQVQLPPGVADMDDSDDDGVFVEAVEDSNTMSYFPPSLSPASFLPRPSAPDSQSIISFLLEAAEVASELYPPQNWDQLQQLVEAVETGSCFDRLRRNALIYYLLLDYHLFPSLSLQRNDTSSPESPRAPMLGRFCTNRMLPDYWRDSIEKAFWRFDKGLYQDAVPWLNVDNSRPYSRHILLTLDPSRCPSDRTNDVAKVQAECLMLYLRLNDPVVSAQLGEEGDAATLRAIVISKAMVSGLSAAVAFIRTVHRSGKIEAQELLAELWSWIFGYHGKSRSTLLKAIVSAPLTAGEVQSLRHFALRKSPQHTTMDATTQALDTLLIRLINQGQVLDALQTNKIAEDALPSTHDVDGRGSVGMEQKRKKREAMLQLASDMLPEILKSQLSLLGPAGTERGATQDIHFDESMQPPSRPESAEPRAAAVKAAPLLTDPDHSITHRGYLPKRPVNEASRAESSADRSASNGVAHAATATPGRKPLNMLSQSPFAGPVGGRASPFNGCTASQLSGLRNSPSLPSSKMAPPPVEPQPDGPYARLAAQLLAQSKEASKQRYAGKEDAQDASMRHDSEDVDPQHLLSSLLPMKRDSSDAVRQAERSATPIRQAERSAVEAAVTQAEPSNSPFDIPKRRYVAKSKDATSGGDQTSTRSKRAKSKPAEPDMRSSRQSRARSMLSPRGDAEDDGELSAVFEVAQPIAQAAFPATATVVPSAKRPSAESGRRGSKSNPPEDAAHSRLTRSKSVVSESMPGSWPEEEVVQQPEPTPMEEEAPEMKQISSTMRGTAALSRSKSTALPVKGKSTGTDQAPLSSTPVRRSRRGSSAAPVADPPRRRATRSQSVASSRFDDEEEDDDENELQSQASQETDADGAETGVSAPRTRARSSGKTTRTSTRSQGTKTDSKSGRSGAKRMTRSMSVLSQQSSLADERVDEEEEEEEDQEVDAAAGDGEGDGGEDDADETPTVQRLAASPAKATKRALPVRRSRRT